MTGIEQLKHVVVLMMENRSFDHMLGALKKNDPRIDGLNGDESNPDMNGQPVRVQAKADFQDQLIHDPDHHFPGTDLQIFGGQQGNGRIANMQGFVKSYFTQTNDNKVAQEIMYYFPPEKLTVLTTLAKEFALFNSWFSSIPGPTICNRAFSHYGTSFGQVGMNIFYIGKIFKAFTSDCLTPIIPPKFITMTSKVRRWKSSTSCSTNRSCLGLSASSSPIVIPAICLLTASLSPLITTIPGPAAVRFSLPISTQPTTFRKANALSVWCTTQFVETTRYGQVQLCWLSMTSTAASTTM
jgi:Phosphoesterase family